MKKTLLFIILCLPIMAMGATKTLVGITAGGLKAALTAPELASTTELIVSGVIDARDFKTMRDDMPLLADIDLSGATVAEYSGADGSGGAIVNFYPQNAIPAMSFTNPTNFLGKTTLTTFIFPKDVSIISGAAFYNCSGLSGSLTIPSTVTTIENSVYYQCTGLTGSLTIPSSVLSLGESAFYGCSKLNGDLVLSNQLSTVAREAFAGCKFTGTLLIPESVTTIGIGAFSGCSGFTGNLILPSLVNTIGNDAFSGCSGINGNIVIPESLTSIGNKAFNSCPGFFDIADQNPNYASLEGVFFNKNKTTILKYPQVKIGSYTIPSSVTTIETRAFASLTNLTGLLVIPESVTIIKDFAFTDCDGISAISIPNSVTSIGVSAFMACDNLVSIIALAQTPIVLGAYVGTFDAINKSTCTLYVPVNTMSLYAQANQWKTFTNMVEGVPTLLKEVSSNTISIYPNPATSTITISELSSLECDQTSTVSIIDVLGNAFLIKEVEPNENTLSIDVSQFKKGIYFINVQTSNGSVVKRFVKE